MKKLVIRQASRALAFASLTTLLYGIWLLGQLFVFPFKKVARRWRQLMFRIWGKAIVAVLGMKIKLHGPLPKPPFFLVANHLGYVDMVLLASLLGCRFVAKAELASWPIMGRLSTSMGAIFINRKKRQDIPRVIKLIEQALSEGEGVIIFPEATTSKGAEVLPFHPPLLQPVAKIEFPVSYATIHYRTLPDEAPAHLAVCWWGDMTFGGHVMELFELSSFEATVIFGPEPIQDANRKILAKKLHHAVKKQFTPIVQ
jgi:1-acyl-sn-glycerol-3-phosphate acyltransferase